MISKLITLTITATLFVLGSYQYISVQNQVQDRLVQTQTEYQNELMDAYNSHPVRK